MSIRKENFFVISGGPGVGKTTLINELKNSGFEIVEENARKIIKNQIDTNQEGLPWKNKEKYAKLMLEESIKSYQNEVSVKNVNPVFFDRGILDSLCYMKMEHISISKHIIELVKQYRYNKTVFILPPWKEIYRTDNERKQDWNEAELTFEKMKETYIEFGYNIILVPKMTLQERIKFVQQNIEKL